MGNRITICHWDDGGHWNAIEVSTNALSGHDNHEVDIWPSIPNVTAGKNWPRGEAVYLNGCQIDAEVVPTPSPSPSSSLPDTGAELAMGFTILSFIMIVVGLLMVARSDKRKNEPPFWREEE